MTPSTTDDLRPLRSTRAVLAGLILLCGAALGACGSDPSGTKEPPPPEEPPLREVAQRRGLLVGAAADRYFNQPGEVGSRYMAVLRREFSVLTPENDMKHERLQPSRDLFNFTRADAMVAFADANSQKVRGHTLVWHRQNARWLTDRSWTRDEARALLEKHVKTVVGHFRGRLAAWDVVNEAIADDGSLRQTFWLQAIGPEYIELAFRWAHEADPGVPLFYNDYSIEWSGPKSNAVYNLIRDLRARGVPIHGIGFQAHFIAGNSPSRSSMVDNFRRFADLGLKIHITELDVRIRQPTTPAQLETQAQAYRDVAEACMSVPACGMIVTWGFWDGDSWVPDSFPGSGDALLFDVGFQPKPSYRALHNAFSGK